MLCEFNESRSNKQKRRPKAPRARTDPRIWKNRMKNGQKTNGKHEVPNGSLRPIMFHYAAPDAKFVYLTGDFSQWRRVAMARRADGRWYVQIALCQGQHQYRFVVDGKVVLDCSAARVELDERGQRVSLLTVG